MRVALLAPLFESVPPRLYGGTERVVHLLCESLQSAGMDVTLFASGDSTAGVRTIPIIDEALRLRSKPVVDPNIYNFKMVVEVTKRLHEFDIIHNHHDYWMLPLTQQNAVPVVTTTHGRLDLPGVATVLSGFPNASFVSISNSQRSPLPDLNWLGTIYHGLDLGKFVFHKAAGKYLAFLGRISKEKNPEWAIRIARKAGVPLKIAAKIEGGESQEYFETAIKPEIDGKFVEYVGELRESEKSEFLGNAHALLFPIDWPEPFGLVVIEALACGTPVLARPCGSVPELLRDGVTGYLSSDLDELSKRVHDVPKISREACRAWAEERFSVERMTEEYIHVYRYLTGLAAHRQRGGPGAGHYRRNLLHPVRRAADGNT